MTGDDNGLAGYMIVAPWEVTAHGGVNGVIRNLVRHMRCDGRVAPLLLQSSWGHRCAEWGTIEGAPAALMRLRSILPNDNKTANWRTCLGYLIAFPVLAWSLEKIFRRYQVRVVNVHYPSMTALTFVLLKALGLFKGRIILTCHGSDVRLGLSLVGVQARGWRALLNGSDQIICVSQYLAGVLESAFPTLRNKLNVVHNGVDFAQFKPVPRGIGRSSGGPRALTVASFDHVKGLDVLLQAIALIVKRYPRMRFTLVGESGAEGGSLRELAAQLGVEPYLEWHCDVPHHEIPAFLADADLFVLPSRSEALSLVLLEAGATGLAVIATRVGGIPEIIQDGCSGLLVSSEDPAALAGGIFWMVEHEDDAARMGRLLQCNVRDHFSWEVASKRYVELGLAS